MIVKVNEINFCYRMDILFRLFVLKNNYWDFWKSFCSLRHNKKVSFDSLSNMLHSIKRYGQKKPVPFFFINGKYFPAGGAKRISCLMFLEKEDIIAEIMGSSSTRKWDDDFSLTSHHFLGMPHNCLCEFERFLELEQYEKRRD